MESEWEAELFDVEERDVTAATAIALLLDTAAVVDPEFDDAELSFLHDERINTAETTK
jgi:hypothetical protein